MSSGSRYYQQLSSREPQIQSPSSIQSPPVQSPRHDEPFMLRATNVSNPSIIHNKASQQSIAASEDYYSLSGSSTVSADGLSPPRQYSASQQTITRFQTPPELYRTPLQSSSNLISQDITDHRPSLDQSYSRASQETQYPRPSHESQEHEAFDDDEQQPFRKTPMRGQGKRRSSVEERQSLVPATSTAGSSLAAYFRRKPVPVSPVLEQRESVASGPPEPKQAMRAQAARSSVARDLDRDRSPPTPGLDDTPYIHFALDQLTRDEEVRGSRRYVGGRDSEDPNYPQLTPLQVHQQQQPLVPQRPDPVMRQTIRHVYSPLSQDEQAEKEQRPQAQDERGVIRKASRQLQQPPRLSGPNYFVPVAASHERPLHFTPAILRPLGLGVFALVAITYLACLVIAAVWSLTNTGLTPYGTLGDGVYFVFRYLPTLLGMLLLYWLFQIEIAVYRIAPFIAMASTSARSRAVGTLLPLQPKGFVLPYIGHFFAGQPVVGIFMITAWLQLFTIPLLAASFNVRYAGEPDIGRWMWVATQGAIWTVIALYILLVIAAFALLIWLMRVPSTGLKWDPRTLADLVVLLERSNALDESASQHTDVPRLGLWRTIERPNEIFHTYGIADKPPRMYAEAADGKLREKLPSSTSAAGHQQHVQRYSDPASDIGDVEAQRAASNDAILPHSSSTWNIGQALPWFLRPTIALLWPVIAIVLLLAFLIVSYLPSTSILRGFAPYVPTIVSSDGFSAGNLLYSILPALLGLLCVLFWLNIDLAYRRLAPFAALAQVHPHHSRADEKFASTERGDSPDHTLLLEYTASSFPLVPLLALANGHLRLAYLSTISLLTLAIPVLAGGCFWSQFSIPDQRVFIYVSPPAYYALTVFLVIYALSYLAIFPERSLRQHSSSLGNLTTFADVKRLVARSQIVDEVAFFQPRDHTDLVTRLIAARPVSGYVLHPQAGQSKASLADSLRGFALARAAKNDEVAAARMAHGEDFEPMYAFARHTARDGGSWWGVDRVRR